MEHLLEAVLLGIIQGITEWLPVSSTGHLRLAEHFLGLTVPILFDITLHIGTLIVILFFFRKDIKNMLTALTHLDFRSEDGRVIPLIVVGSIPTALIGLAFSDQIESTFRSPVPIAIALIICGTLLFTARFTREKTSNVTYKEALIIGIAQGLAIIPGFSRSGTTIAVALMLGLRREKAFRFSFLLSIPAIVGALGLMTYKEHETLTQAGLSGSEILVGVTITIIVGYFALRLLRKIIESRKFYFFASYCWLLGSALIVLSLFGF